MRLPGRTSGAIALAMVTPLGATCDDPVGADGSPRVVAITPANLARDVARSTAITATFSEQIASGSAGEAAFRVRSQPDGQAVADVAGAVTVSGRTVTFTPAPGPSTGLRSGITYLVTIDGFTDAAGNRQRTPFTSTFTVFASPSPRLVSWSPAENATDVVRTATVIARFSEPIDPASVTAATFTLATLSGNNPVAGTRTVSGGVLTFTPSAPLLASTQYVARVTPGLMSLEGALVSDYSWFFTTAASATAGVARAGNTTAREATWSPGGRLAGRRTTGPERHEWRIPARPPIVG